MSRAEQSEVLSDVPLTSPEADPGPTGSPGGEGPWWWRDPRWRRRLILVGLWAAIAVALYAFRAVLLPFVGAFLLAYVIEPLVRGLTRLRVRRFRMPRFGAIVLIYAALFGILWIFAVTAVPRLYREAQRMSLSAQGFLAQLDDQGLDEQISRLEVWLAEQGFVTREDEVPEFRGALSIDLTELARTSLQRVSATLRSGVFEAVAVVQRVAGTIVDAVFHLGLLLMLTAFVSIDIARIKRTFLSLVPAGYQGDADNLMDRIDAGLSGVVRGQLTIMLINGALTVVGLWLLDVKFVVLLGLVATVTYIVPIFGTIISSVPIMLVAMGDSVSKAVGITLWLVGVHLIEAYYLNPKVLGDASRIHPVLIVFALLAGEHVGGVVGALLAVPAMSVALAIFRFAHRRVFELGEAQPDPAE